MLTQIAYIDWNTYEGPVHLLPDTLIFRHFYTDRIVFRSWDYRSTYFSVDIFEVFSVLSRMPKLAFNKFIGQIFTMKTAIQVFCDEEILFWAIPSLLPRSPDHFLDDNPTHLPPPLFKIPFPHGIVYDDVRDLRIISSWYLGSRESIYFDILRSDLRLDRFKLVVKPDHSEASLHAINTSILTPRNFEIVSLQASSRLCEDALVSLWRWSDGVNYECGAYTESMSARLPATSPGVTGWSDFGLIPYAQHPVDLYISLMTMIIMMVRIVVVNLI